MFFRFFWLKNQHKIKFAAVCQREDVQADVFTLIGKVNGNAQKALIERLQWC